MLTDERERDEIEDEEPHEKGTVVVAINCRERRSLGVSMLHSPSPI